MAFQGLEGMTFGSTAGHSRKMFQLESTPSRFPVFHSGFDYGGDGLSRYYEDGQYRSLIGRCPNAQGYQFRDSLERRQSGSVTSNGSDELESVYQQNHLYSGVSPSCAKTFQPSAAERGGQHCPEKWYHFTDQTNLNQTDTKRPELPQGNLQTDSENVYWTNFGERDNIRYADGDFITVRVDNKISYVSSGNDHLSKITTAKKDLNRNFHSTHLINSSEEKNGGPKLKKKRYRPFAAQRERERLIVMNTALKRLKMSLPFEQQKQKLSKKAILEMASLYIKYLSNTLEQTDSTSVTRTVNLSEHDYITHRQGLSTLL